MSSHEKTHSGAAIAGAIFTGIAVVIAAGSLFYKKNEASKEQNISPVPPGANAPDGTTPQPDPGYGGGGGGGIQYAPTVVVPVPIPEPPSVIIDGDPLGSQEKIVAPKPQKGVASTVKTYPVDVSEKDAFTKSAVENQKFYDAIPKLLVEDKLVNRPISHSAYAIDLSTVQGYVASSVKPSSRVEAISKTLATTNPGQSSAPQVTNFSRLKALNADLSKVDLLGVQNQSYLPSIKTGQGPLTEDQKVLAATQVVNANNKTTKGTQTVQEYLLQRDQVAKAQSISASNAARLASIKTSLSKTFTSDGALNNLKQLGYYHSSPITLDEYAAIISRLGK